MKTLVVKFIEWYQGWISGLLKPSCVFYPSCSEYAKQAVTKYGVLKGVYLGLRRILRCHPWQKNHMDPLE